MKKLIITIAIILTGLNVSAQVTNKLSLEDRNYWNGFVDFVATKGFKNSPLLDNKKAQLAQTLFNFYNLQNKRTVDYKTFVTSVQMSITYYRNRAINDIKAGKSLLDGYKLGDTTYNFDKHFMIGLSAVDGFAGSKTTSWKFPKETVNIVDTNTGKITGIKHNDFYEN